MAEKESQTVWRGTACGRGTERNEDGCSPHLIPALVVRVEICLPSLSLPSLSSSFVKYSKQAKQTFGILCTPHGLTRAIQQPLVRFDSTETFRSRKIVFSFRLLFRGSFFRHFCFRRERERERGADVEIFFLQPRYRISTDCSFSS